MLGEDGYRWFIDVGEAIREGRIDEALTILEEMQGQLKRRLRIDEEK